MTALYATVSLAHANQLPPPEHVFIVEQRYIKYLTFTFTFIF